MKISIISGSPRKNGATAPILHDIRQELLKNEDVEVTVLSPVVQAFL